MCAWVDQCIAFTTSDLLLANKNIKLFLVHYVLVIHACTILYWETHCHRITDQYEQTHAECRLPSPFYSLSFFCEFSTPVIHL